MCYCVFSVSQSFSSVRFDVLCLLGDFLSQLMLLQAIPGSMSSKEIDDSEVKEEKSEIYSSNMTEAMGAGKFAYAKI